MSNYGDTLGKQHIEPFYPGIRRKSTIKDKLHEAP